MSAWVKSRHSRRKSHVCFTPESGHVRRNEGCPLCANSGHARQFLFNHLIGARERRRHSKTERFGGVEVDQELKFGWLLDWKLARFRALQELVHINGHAITDGIVIHAV